MMMQNPYDIFLKRFGAFTGVQQASFETIEKGGNCVISAPTGSGKTEAAILPIFNRLLKGGSKEGISVVYITPLRALNRDLIKRLQTLAGDLGISISVRHGDTPTKERQLQAANPPQVLITTPETLQNLFLSARLRGALANVKVIVIDELHELYSNKRGAQLAVALERVVELAGEYQRVGISATLGNGDEARRFLCGERQCRMIEVRGTKEISAEIVMPTSPRFQNREFREKFNLDAETLARLEKVAELVKASNSTLIFANTRQVVESLGSKLIYMNKNESFGGIGVHHSSLDKDERIKTENEFKEGKIKSIIATSSLELGIDIGAVNLVIQYGSPRQVIRLIQRVGRGGHREKEVSYGKVIVANHIEVLESLAIINQMKAGRIEKAELERGALDVLANQICAIALEYRKAKADDIYRIIKRSSPYTDLERPLFDRMVEFLAQERLVRSADGFVGIGFRSRSYFFSNISVIPDTKRFYVKNAAVNRVISTLDEGFVSNYLEEGVTFITKGLPWKVISIEKDTVFVEPGVEIEAAVPDWEGEDIPVSRETAEGVFELIKKGITEGGASVEKSTAAGTNDFIESQKRYFSPGNSIVAIEELDGYAIAHTGLGKLANELLAKLLAHEGSRISGGRIGVRTTPYALIIDFGGVRRRPEVKSILNGIKNYSADAIIRVDGFLANTDLFRYKFVQICKLFGIVDKKATVTKNNADRLVSFYKESPIAEETIRDLKKNYLDLESVSEFLESLRKGKTEVKVFQGVASPLANELLKASYYYRELLLPTLPDEAAIREFEQKINEKKAELLCTYCGMEFSKDINVEKDEKIVCPNCRSPMVAIYGDDEANVIKKKIAGRQLTELQGRKYRDAIREASLVEAYGSRAVAALSVYGVGIATAARALKLLRKDYKRFIMDLIEAQKTFVRTKKYWK